MAVAACPASLDPLAEAQTRVQMLSVLRVRRIVSSITPCSAGHHLYCPVSLRSVITRVDPEDSVSYLGNRLYMHGGTMYRVNTPTLVPYSTTQEIRPEETKGY